MKISSTPIVITTIANSGAIPADTRLNPVNIWGSVIDGGTSTYALQYTTSDVFAAGYSAASDPMWTTVPGAPTTGSKPFNVTGIGLTAIRISVSATATSVTLGPVFQSDNTLGS